MKRILFVLLMFTFLVAPKAFAQMEGMEHPLNITPDKMQWNPMVPELAEKSSMITILHTDPVTKATQLMIRVPANFHVPKHWHSANEVHVIMEGTFVMECDGKRETLTKGSFNYVPKTMQHEAWTTPDEGALLFITVDSAWDINWVNGEPKPQDFMGGMKP
jgi:mannose-6-phosphate isomerase-like protein (cupin superfamily)